MTIKPLSTSIAFLLSSTLLAQAGPDAMTPQEARHLLARTGFGAAPQEIAALTGKSYAEGVEEIIAGIRQEPLNPMPAWADHWGYPVDYIGTLGQTVTDFYFTTRYQEIDELSQWWLSEMVSTPSPLTERLTLFWHDHFASSYENHEDPQWFANQNAMFRTHAAGNFADLASYILRDPAMLMFLSNTENVKDAPNENLAREFFELFTLGEGRGYTENDIKDAARALTGHGIEDLGAATYRFYAEEHDDGKKVIFGERGRFDASDLVTLTLNNPEFGPYIVEKLWITFVSDKPDPDQVAVLADLWKTNNYELKPLLKAMFLTEAFWDPANRGRLIKSPVELLVGTVRSLGLPFNRYQEANWILGDMDQALFFPPNVAGWTGGTAWINDANAATRATTLVEMLNDGYDPDFVEAPSAPMMATADAPKIVETAPTDLRVGEVFIPEANRWDEGGGYGMLMYLYDVSFAGQTYRSLPLWIEVNDGGEEEFVAFYLRDCGAACFPQWERVEDEPYWVGLGLYEGADEDLQPSSDEDLALIRAVMGHLPEMLARTKDRLIWSGRYEEWQNPDEMASYDEMRGVLQGFTAKARDIYGAPDGQLVIASSPQGSLGLGMVTDYGSLSRSFDQMVDMQEEAMRQTAQAAYVFDSADDWLAALPFDGPQSLNAEAALLAVPMGGEAQRVEMIARDPEALLRSIVLSPHFQLN